MALFKSWPLLLLCWVLLLSTSAHAHIFFITQAQATLKPAGLPLEQRTVLLPHSWNDVFPGRPGDAEYRINLPPIDVNVPHGLYIPRVGNQVEIWIGEQSITKLGRIGDSSFDAAKSPLWVTLPSTTLSADTTTTLRIVVDIQASRWGGLTAVQFGPVSELMPIYRSRYVWRQWGAVAVVFSLMLMAVLAAGLWVLQREAVYGYFALGAVCGVVRNADRIIDQPPLPWPIWGAVAAAALSAHALLFLRFSLAVVQRNTHLVQQLFWGLLCIELCAAAYAFFAGVPQVWFAALVLLAPPAIATFAIVLKVALTERSREAIALSLATPIVLMAGLRDLVIVKMSKDGAENFSILPHATMVFVLLLGWIIIDRHVRQTRAYHGLVASLDEKVRARETELELINAKLRQEQTQQATLEERQRIMRDIHDGVGAQLVGLIGLINKDTSRREDLQEHAHAALDELRMAVDAMQPVNGDIATVLATLRYRLQPRLAAAGIAIDWQVGDLPVRDDLTPQVVLQLQRILLEAFTNVLQHAKATRITVIARLEEQPSRRLVMELTDNGVGFSDAEPSKVGQGLRSMHARAQNVGAQLSINHVPTGGTRVLLSLSA